MIRADDAAALVDFMNKIAGDTDNLACSLSDVEKLDAASERLFIAEMRKSPSVYAVAVSNGEIIGSCDIRVSDRPRVRHRGELAIAVRKEFWGSGVAQHLFEFAVAEAKEKGVRKINLDVRKDNARAIAFYKRNGFVSEGFSPMLMFVDGEYVDGEHFGLVL